MSPNVSPTFKTRWEKEALLAADPEVFFTTPHYDGYPTVLVHLEAVDVEELTELIVDSWRIKAPKRVLAAHQHDLPVPPDPAG